MLFASANRDELAYDNPNQFNINRNFKEHLGFGHGIHSCVGMHLAQIEMMSLLEAMIPYVKRIETGKPQPLMNNTICGFSKLPTKLIPI
jgi:cytochrome P450